MKKIFENFWYRNLLYGLVLGLIFSTLFYKQEYGINAWFINFIFLSIVAALFSMLWDKLLNRNKK